MKQKLIKEILENLDKKFSLVDMRWDNETWRAWWKGLRQFLTDSITKSFDAGRGDLGQWSCSKCGGGTIKDVRKIQKETRQKLLEDVEKLEKGVLNGKHKEGERHFDTASQLAILEDIKNLIN